jgi:adenine-specific DNA-methyltransferase
MSKKELGQYFTVDEDLQKYVFSITKHKGQLLLEPSFGAGHLLKPYLAVNPNYPMVCCEIDKKVVPIVNFLEEKQIVIYADFIKETFVKKFKTIVGNPPYVKVEKGKNLYLQFIEKCISLLDVDGELIFIVPSDFLKLTSASALIQKMVSNGSFTDFLYPNDEKLFDDSVVDVVVFRYQKGLNTRTCIKNGVETTWQCNSGIITFGSKGTTTIDQQFDCYVGFVSGRDEVFCNDLGSMTVLCDKDKVKKFICVTTFPTGVKAVDDHLNAHKAELLERKIKKFDTNNWFTWGAIRNKAAIDENAGADCIYVRTMTRKTVVAFVGKVMYFSGALLCLIPKTADINLDAVVKVLNSTEVKKDYMYSGRFKIGQKQVRFITV